MKNWYRVNNDTEVMVVPSGLLFRTTDCSYSSADGGTWTNRIALAFVPCSEQAGAEFIGSYAT